MYPEFLPFPGDPKRDGPGFTDLRTALGKEAVAFGKPVVLVHGDSHYFRVDKPYTRLRRGPEDPTIEILTRVESFGTPNHHWLQVTVEVSDPNVFTFRPRIIAANVLKVR